MASVASHSLQPSASNPDELLTSHRLSSRKDPIALPVTLGDDEDRSVWFGHKTLLRQEHTDLIVNSSGEWTLQPGSLNCYDDHGAPGASGEPYAMSIPLDECKRACLAASGCQAVVVQLEYPPAMRTSSELVTCFLRDEGNHK